MKNADRTKILLFLICVLTMLAIVFYQSKSNVVKASALTTLLDANEVEKEKSKVEVTNTSVVKKPTNDDLDEDTDKKYALESVTHIHSYIDLKQQLQEEIDRVNEESQKAREIELNRRRIEEEKRLEELRRIEEQKRLEEQRRIEEEKRLEEERKKIEEQKRLEEERLQAEKQSLNNVEQSSSSSQANTYTAQDETTTPTNQEPVSNSTGVLRTLYVEATAYTSFDGGCTGVTASGVDVSNTIYYQGMRIIAVDRNVIPLYSIVNVYTNSGSFKAIALDTGGAIKGNKIDVLVSTHDKSVATQFGRQYNVKLEVLREGSGK